MRLKDIAAQAGVSTATVSNVINKNYSKVSQETIDKVERIIAENNYSPNAMAKGLASKESKIIGVVVPNVGDAETFARSPYNVQIISRLENYIRMQGYTMMLRCVVQSKDVLWYFHTWNVDGIIFFGTFKDEVEKIQEQIKVPSMYIDTYGEDLEIANVGSDDYEAEYMATKYMLDKGHRNLLFVGPGIEFPGVIQQRYYGFSDALKEFGVNITEENRIETATSYEDGVEVGKMIASLEQDFTGIVCTADVLAVGIIQGMRLCGKNCPDDYSIIGFDNLDMCKYCHPQLTSVSQSIEDKAVFAAKSIIEMAQKREQMVVDRKVKITIAERASVGEVC